MNLVIYPNHILRKELKPVTEFDGVLEKIGQNMLEIMQDNDGVGLAANQVGINTRMFVTSSEFISDNIICNPTWSPKIYSKKFVEIEGCLSFPKIFVPVIRHVSINVQYQNVKGKTIVTELTGFGARIFQHESDHLDGKLFVDNLPKDTLKVIKKLFGKAG